MVLEKKWHCNILNVVNTCQSRTSCSSSVKGCAGRAGSSGRCGGEGGCCGGWGQAMSSRSRGAQTVLRYGSQGRSTTCRHQNIQVSESWNRIVQVSTKYKQEFCILSFIRVVFVYVCLTTCGKSGHRTI